MKQICVVLFLSVLIFSCGSKKEREPDSDAAASAFALERENFFNSLKNPDDVASLIPGATAFDSTMLNNPDHYYQYINNNVRAAANLGIYMADLNYCILYRKSTHTDKYFQATHELSRAIQIEKGILEFLMKRYQSSIDQNDSIRLLVNEWFRQSTTALQGTDRERLAGIAMAGYQIENLHLVLTLLESFPDQLTGEQVQTKKQLQQYVLDQRGKFEVVYNFVRANADPLNPDQNPNFPFFDNAFRELIVVYRTVSETDPRMNELRGKVDAVRNKIVSL